MRVGIKRVPGGKFSNFANEALRAGQAIDVMTPDTAASLCRSIRSKRGTTRALRRSGITPMLALIKATLAVEPGSRFTLIYGNRSVPAIMFAEELEDLKNRYLGRLALYHVLSDEAQDIELFSGLAGPAEMQRFPGHPGAGGQPRCGVYLRPGADDGRGRSRPCGKPAVAREKIHIERFGIPLPQAGVSPVEISDSTPTAQLVVIADGKERTLRIPFAGIKRARYRLARRHEFALCLQRRRLLHLSRART